MDQKVMRSVYLDLYTDGALDARAEDEGITKAELIRNYITAGLERPTRAFQGYLKEIPPVLRDISCNFEDTPNGGVIIELYFDNRRVGFVFEKDNNPSSSGWFMASKPPHDRDGSGYLTDGVTTAAIIKRGLSG